MSTPTQRAQARRPPPARSAGAPPKLTFAWEPFHNIAGELPKLWKMHWEEVAIDRDTVPLDPDWRTYFIQEEAGVLHVLTARSRNGTLAGYVFNVVGPHKHYASTVSAHTEMFWLHPYFRKGWQPVRMFSENLRGLKERGAVFATINFKLSFEDARVGRLLARLGYRATDIVMRKGL